LKWERSDGWISNNSVSGLPLEVSSMMCEMLHFDWRSNTLVLNLHWCKQMWCHDSWWWNMMQWQLWQWLTKIWCSGGIVEIGCHVACQRDFIRFRISRWGAVCVCVFHRIRQLLRRLSRWLRLHWRVLTCRQRCRRSTVVCTCWKLVSRTWRSISYHCLVTACCVHWPASRRTSASSVSVHFVDYGAKYRSNYTRCGPYWVLSKFILTKR